MRSGETGRRPAGIAGSMLIAKPFNVVFVGINVGSIATSSCARSFASSSRSDGAPVKSPDISGPVSLTAPTDRFVTRPSTRRSMNHDRGWCVRCAPHHLRHRHYAQVAHIDAPSISRKSADHGLNNPCSLSLSGPSHQLTVRSQDTGRPTSSSARTRDQRSARSLNAPPGRSGFCTSPGETATLFMRRYGNG